jgi:hypothetical protein
MKRYWAEVVDSVVVNVVVGNSFNGQPADVGFVETFKKSGVDNPRKNYAGIGYTYDATRDAFIPPKPFASWVLNEETACWDAPVAYPTGTDVMHFWDEGSVSWRAAG